MVIDDLGFAYSIDRQDALTSVSDSWLEFARENGAKKLTRDFVVGQPLWRFIAGRETRLLQRREPRLGIIAGILSFQPVWHTLLLPILPGGSWISLTRAPRELSV